uniref:Coiled-coil domain containing 50 n=1 Tax=Aquila chrysaetos chrysaetos TaxID=223781 RepID=A0A663DNR2_AQUCH
GRGAASGSPAPPRRFLSPLPRRTAGRTVSIRWQLCSAGRGRRRRGCALTRGARAEPSRPRPPSPPRHGRDRHRPLQAARSQRRERQDCEIAQEIQVKLVFEAEQRRRQEEKDEDIARLLQQKELQEEKKRKKHYPESQGHTVYEDSYYAENGGTKLRGAQQAMYDTPQREQELSDAEIARKLQEEELLANEADQKAAQVAQDEEIARLLMAEEKKAFKKEKEREKSSFEKRRHDQDWRQDASESTRSRSKEGPETQRHKGDRSSRSQPLLDDFEHARYYTSQPSPLRHVPRPEHSPKGRIKPMVAPALGLLWAVFLK